MTCAIERSVDGPPGGAGVGQDPYPTSPDDVLGWLREHYREHVEQCPQLIASWREMS